MSLFSRLFCIKESESGESKRKRMCQQKIDAIKAKYDMYSIDGIESIPVPKYRVNSDPLGVTVQIEYILQRVATEHKKNGNIELAIACLKKANDIMPCSSTMYSKKDYERVVQYLKENRQFDEARHQQKLIDNMFTKQGIPWEVDKKQKRMIDDSGTDLLCVGYSACCCAECSKYGGRVYSKYGTSKQYPAFPQWLKDNRNHCGLSVYPFFKGSLMLDSNGKKVDPVKYSNRPFTDERTAEQVELFESKKVAEAEEKIDREQYDWICEFISSVAPKSFAAYRKMKRSQSVGYEKIKNAAKEKGVEL